MREILLQGPMGKVKTKKMEFKILLMFINLVYYHIQFVINKNISDI